MGKYMLGGLMRIKLLIKITSVDLVLLGLSLRSAVSAGGSDEEVFPPKTLEKLKKNYSTEQKKSKSIDNGNKEVKKSEQKEAQNLSSTKNEEKN